jgi:Sec-independent protein translocase protein TatA
LIFPVFFVFCFSTVGKKKTRLKMIVGVAELLGISPFQTILLGIVVLVSVMMLILGPAKTSAMIGAVGVSLSACSSGVLDIQAVQQSHIDEERERKRRNAEIPDTVAIGKQKST